MLGIKKNSEGKEIKAKIGIKMLASVWNKAQTNAKNRGTNLNALLQSMLIEFNKNCDSDESQLNTGIDIKKF